MAGALCTLSEGGCCAQLANHALDVLAKDCALSLRKAEWSERAIFLLVRAWWGSAAGAAREFV